MSIEWQESFKIGDAEVDASQAALFQLVNEIIENDDWIALRPKIIALFKQMQKQFDLEEAVMAKIGFADAKAHADAHKQLLMRVRDRSMDVGKGHMNKKAIVAVMTEWAQNHVTAEDAKLARALAVAA